MKILNSSWYIEDDNDNCIPFSSLLPSYNVSEYKKKIMRAFIASLMVQDYPGATFHSSPTNSST